MTNSKKKIVFMLSFLGFLFLFIIGVSYAYFVAEVKGNLSENPSLKLTSGYLSIVYDGGTSEITGGSTEGTTTDLVYTKTFSITNNGVADSNFGIWIKNYQVLDSLGNETVFERGEDWTYVLSSGDTIIKTGTFPVEDESIISVYPISIGETIPLTFTLTYNYITAEEGGTNQTADMGKVLSFDISVIQSIDNLKNTSEGTLLYAINEDYQSSIIRNESNLISTPGREESLSNESIIATTEDDYGTSYYYRGNVRNNYVTYSNMCWRIVRVQGDGSIKLALADGNNPCGTANGYSTLNKSSAFVEDASGTAITNIAYKANAVYDTSDFQFENSDIPLVLSTWAERNNLDMSGLIETEWCNDTTLKKQIFYDENNNEVEIGSNLISYTRNYYGSYSRLNSIQTAQPSLKCNIKGMVGTTGIDAETQKYKNVLGILSADEIAFAGSTVYKADKTWAYYLQTNAAGNFYWTLSPTFLEAGKKACAWSVSGVGFLSNAYYFIENSSGAVRPSVVLRSDVMLSTETDYIQDGTVDKPYVIN